MVDVVTWERRANEQATNRNILAFYTLTLPSKAPLYKWRRSPMPGLVSLVQNQNGGQQAGYVTVVVKRLSPAEPPVGSEQAESKPYDLDH